MVGNAVLDQFSVFTDGAINRENLFGRLFLVLKIVANLLKSAIFAILKKIIYYIIKIFSFQDFCHANGKLIFFSKKNKF